MRQCYLKTYNHHVSHRRNGFTMLEILATFVLIALIVPVTMEGLSLIVRVADRSVQKVQACSLAEQKLGELIVTGEYVNGDQAGDMGSEYPDYEWKLSVTDWTDSSLKKLVFRVQWYDRQRLHEVMISTIMYAEETVE